MIKTVRKFCAVCRKPAYTKLCAACYRIRMKFRVEPVDIQRLRVDQDYGCAVCGKLNNGLALAIDHDHRTHKVRGLLCTRCNVGLGCLSSIELLQKAIGYLEKPLPDLKYISENDIRKIIPVSEEDIKKVESDVTLVTMREKARVLASIVGSTEEAAVSRIRRYRYQLKLEEHES